MLHNHYMQVIRSEALIQECNGSKSRKVITLQKEKWKYSFTIDKRLKARS